MADTKQLLDRGGGALRSGSRQLVRVGRAATSFAAGKAKAVANRGSEPKDLDDRTLKSKVETEIFREEGAPKGSVDVNVVDGVVELRGQVKRPEDKKALEAKARKVPEVRDVNNLLHLPKTPAPTRADSPGRQRRKAGA
jgi:osmotically-inducible protein OsmY